jgi:hypothetical protein
MIFLVANAPETMWWLMRLQEQEELCAMESRELNVVPPHNEAMGVVAQASKALVEAAPDPEASENRLCQC